jgi:hypothetical protein
VRLFGPAGVRPLVLALVTAMAVACRGGDAGPRPPSAEFLFAAGDSTWWVKSGAEGVRVRSAPILLTFTDGKFYEIFVSEDGEEFEDASLASARVYSREILKGDSLAIFDDPTARREIARWKRANPNAQSLSPDDELDAEEPTTAITDEIEIIDVHGPWVTVQHSLDIDVEGRTGHRHARRRAVLDVRSGRRASLATLFGAQASANAIRSGRAALEALKDSVRALGDERADRARETLESFRFDVTSFALTDLARSPAITFTVPGNDADGSAIVLTLPPIAMPTQPWWMEVQPTLPEWAADSAAVRWQRQSYAVSATPVGDGSALSLFISDRDTVNGRVPREWELATVLSPAYQLIAFDDKPISRELRSALSRAFDAAATVDGIGQRVGRRVAPLLVGKATLQQAVYQRVKATRAIHGRPHE